MRHPPARLASPPRASLDIALYIVCTTLWAILCACGGSHVITPFPPGVTATPLTALPAAPPPAQGQLITAHGALPDGGFWVEGRAIIPEPIDDIVSTFLSDPSLMVDTEEVATFTATWDVEPDYPHSVRIHQVTSGLISVSFDVTWRMAPQLEPDGTLTAFAAVYQKTAGSSLIKAMRGSISARKLTPFATEVEFYALLDAPTVTSADLDTSIQRMFERLRARVSGSP